MELGDAVKLVAVAVNVAVAVVELSVIVSVPVAEPTVSTTVAEVSEMTVGVPRLAPVPPVKLNSVLGVSWVQTVFVPVSVRVGVVPVAPDVGEIASVAVATTIVVEMESVVSVMVEVPVPAPVVIVTVSTVEEIFDALTKVAGLDAVNIVLPVHEVPTPMQLRARFAE
jgi:hypothetical protein